jgi:hypothetical protein
MNIRKLIIVYLILTFLVLCIGAVSAAQDNNVYSEIWNLKNSKNTQGSDYWKTSGTTNGLNFKCEIIEKFNGKPSLDKSFQQYLIVRGGPGDRIKSIKFLANDNKTGKTRIITIKGENKQNIVYKIDKSLLIDVFDVPAHYNILKVSFSNNRPVTSYNDFWRVNSYTKYYNYKNLNIAAGDSQSSNYKAVLRFPKAVDFSKPYLGYVIINNHQKSGKIKLVKLLIRDGKKSYVKTVRGNNKNKQIIKLGKHEALNVFERSKNYKVLSYIVSYNPYIG